MRLYFLASNEKQWESSRRMRIQSPNENPVAEEKDDVEGQETDEKYPWPMKKEKRS